MSESLATRGYSQELTGSSGPTPPSISVTGNVIVLTWSVDVTITLIGQTPEYWEITTTAYPVTVLSASQTDTNEITLATSDQTTGGSYSLSIQAAAVTDSGGAPNSACTLAFTGAGQAPSLTAAIPQTPRTVMAVFSEEVVEAEALDLDNYAVDGGLTRSAIAKVSATEYLLTTSDVRPGDTYHLTVTGVHDLAGNEIA